MEGKGRTFFLRGLDEPVRNLLVFGLGLPQPLTGRLQWNAGHVAGAHRWKVDWKGSFWYKAGGEGRGGGGGGSQQALPNEVNWIWVIADLPVWVKSQS